MNLTIQRLKIVKKSEFRFATNAFLLQSLLQGERRRKTADKKVWTATNNNPQKHDKANFSLENAIS